MPRGTIAVRASAHPRVGGENMLTRISATSSSGSSPRGRGKRGAPHDEPEQLGLIPAWAGKTALKGERDPIERAHPRVGGENWNHSTTTETAAGSSPRGRGKRRRLDRAGTRRRLIPAWAGKTGDRSRGGQPPPAHPRVGGENSVMHGDLARVTGSSPRGRGKHETGRTALEILGLIPAWAGKTATSTTT